MHVKTFIIAFILLVTSADTKISMAGVSIGDSDSALAKVKLQILAEEGDTKKYRSVNGNDFSITLLDGKVVYMENDWLQDAAGRQPLITGFQFGTTSLADIRKSLGNNGFTFTAMWGFTTETHVIQLNCYEADSANKEVIAFVTKVPLDADVTEATIAEKLKLDAIIIADMEYLNLIWGEEKLFDPNYKKIKL